MNEFFVTNLTTAAVEGSLSSLRLISSALTGNRAENATNNLLHDSSMGNGLGGAMDDDLLDYSADATGGTGTQVMGPDCMNYNGNITYLNVSCETILNYSVPLYGYCTPFLLMTTVTANTIIVLVLNKRNMATPTNLVLMGMSNLYYYALIAHVKHETAMRTPRRTESID